MGQVSHIEMKDVGSFAAAGRPIMLGAPGGLLAEPWCGGGGARHLQRELKDEDLITRLCIHLSVLSGKTGWVSRFPHNPPPTLF